MMNEAEREKEHQREMRKLASLSQEAIKAVDTLMAECSRASYEGHASAVAKVDIHIDEARKSLTIARESFREHLPPEPVSVAYLRDWGKVDSVPSV